MPKRGASSSLIWRSRSSGRPVTSTCRGARKPRLSTGGRNIVDDAVGDEDHAREPAPAGRRRGRWKAPRTAGFRRRRVRHPPGCSAAPRRSASRSRAAVRRGPVGHADAVPRSATSIDRSTTATISFTFSRSSWISEGLASAATTSASAAARTSATGPREISGDHRDEQPRPHHERPQSRRRE